MLMIVIQGLLLNNKKEISPCSMTLSINSVTYDLNMSEYNLSCET
jgi:hypothetical protein